MSAPPVGSWLPHGPEALGFAIGADAQIADGWLVRPLRIPPGLHGPDGILQGGFAASVPLLAARMADTFGAPLTRITSRLHAPTPLDAELRIALRPGDGPATHEVEVRDGDRRLVSSTVELAGHDPAPRVADLTDLAAVPLPPLQQQEVFERCWVCGGAPDHTHGQAIRFGYHGDAVVVPWVGDEVLASDAGVVDPLVVGAMLDCPGVWSAMPQLLEEGWLACLMGGLEIRHYRDVPSYEPLRLIGRLDSIDGRKVRVRTGLVDEAGVVYAIGAGLHVAVDHVPEV